MKNSGCISKSKNAVASLQLSLDRYIRAFVDRIDRIYPEVFDPGLYDIIISAMPHEDPGRILNNARFGLMVEAVPFRFIHRPLCRFDDSIELRIKAPCSVASRTHAF